MLTKQSLIILAFTVELAGKSWTRFNQNGQPAKMFLLKIKNIKLHMPTRPFSCSRFEPYDIRTSVRTTILSYR